MKHNILKLSIATAIIMMSLWACKKEETNPTNSSLIQQYEHVGKVHNENLDYILNEIKKEKINNTSLVEDKQKLNEVIDLSCNKIIIDNSFNKKETEIMNIVSKIYKNQTYSRSDEKNKKIEEIYSKISTGCIELIEKLNSIMDSEEDSLDILVSQVKELEKLGLTKISIENEITLFLSSTSVAKSTLQYWNKNIEEWKNTLTGGNATASRAESPWYKEAAKEDVTGAVIGAGTAVVINVVPGAGQVGYGVAIAGGAVSASAYSAVRSFIDWLWE